MVKKNGVGKIGRPALEFSIASSKDQLVAPLIMPKPSWNSVDVAKFTGLSQSTISRTWQNAYPITESPISKIRSLDLLAISVTNDGTFLLFEYAPKLQNAQTQNEHFMRSTKRRAFQVILASALLNDRITEKASYEKLIEFVKKQNFENFILISSARLPIELDELGIESVVINDSTIWHSCLHDLVTNSNMTKQESLDAIQFALMPWARNPKINFYWQKANILSEVRVTQKIKPLALNQVLSDQALNLIMSELRLGRLKNGDRITESYLAKHLHTSRNQARDVIKNLAVTGLLDFQSPKSAVIPSPSMPDIADIYEARRALGSVVFKRAAALTQSELADAKIVLDRMHELGKMGNALETGLHDILFQETVAACTGMRNFYEMFHALADQLRLFIEILGLNYMYEIDDMCTDNQNIYEALIARDADRAVAIWLQKMDDAQADWAKKIGIWRRQN